MGTGGGIFFGLIVSSKGLGSSLGLGGVGRDLSGVVSCELVWGGEYCLAIGVDGSGLFTSELLVRLILGGDVGSVTSNSSNGTVCGCLGATSLP
jgi:hypothetical protein